MPTRRLLQLLGDTRARHVALLVAITIVKGLFWIALLPPLMIADEPAHFDDVQYRAEHGSPPTSNSHGYPLERVIHDGASTEIRTLWWTTKPKIYYSTSHRTEALPLELERLASTPHGRDTDGQATGMVYPGFYYESAVPFYDAFRHSSVVTRIFSVRCLSLLWGLVAVLCTYFAARLVTTDVVLCLAAALVVVLQPMESQMTAAVNNDSAVLGLAALLFYFALRALADLPRWPSPITIVGAMLAALAMVYTKPTGYGMFPAVALAGAISVGAHLRERRVQVVSVVGVMLFFVALLWAVRGHPLLPGDADHPGPDAQSDFILFLEHIHEDYVRFLLKSAWGQFGWLDYAVPDAWVPLLHGVFELVVVGTFAAFGAWSLRDLARPFWFEPGRLAFCIFTAVVGVAFVLFAEHRLRLAGMTGVIQGRAFLYVLPPFAIWLTVSLAAVVPHRMRGLTAAALVMGATIFHAVGILTIVKQHYGR